MPDILKKKRYLDLKKIKFDSVTLPEDVLVKEIELIEYNFAQGIEKVALFPISAWTDAKSKGLQEVYPIRTRSKVGIARHLAQESGDVVKTSENYKTVNISPLRPAGAEEVDMDYELGRAKFNRKMQALTDANVLAFAYWQYATIMEYPVQTATVAYQTTDARKLLMDLTKAIRAFLSDPYVSVDTLSLSVKLQNQLQDVTFNEVTGETVYERLEKNFRNLTFIARESMNIMDSVLVYKANQAVSSLELPLEIVSNGITARKETFVGRHASLGVVIEVPENFLNIEITGAGV